MEETLEFPALLRLTDGRSMAFRAAVMAAPGLELQVPTCPEWTLLDLVQHLGEVHRFWAAAVNAGPAAAPPAESASEVIATAPREREPLLAWSAESTRQLLDALRRAGPDRGCWTWWGTSQSPQNSGAVARHQVQEATVHTYDAQITLGTPPPLPDAAAPARARRNARHPGRPDLGCGLRLRPGHSRRTGPRPIWAYPDGLPETRWRPTSIRPAPRLGSGRVGRAMRLLNPEGM